MPTAGPEDGNPAPTYVSATRSMPTTLPTLSGAAMSDGYADIFRNVRLSVTFTVDELVVAGASVAYALTRSNGVQTVTANGEKSKESNREVFIFAREDGPCEISRYLFDKPE